jgi:hypothetical protein
MIQLMQMESKGGETMAKQTAAAQQVYQLKVTLAGSKPPIWRRLLVTGDTRLPELSNIILAAMGWGGYHLHQFVIGDTYYGEPHPDYGDLEMRDESKVTLTQIAGYEKATFRYEYDFGDDWQHNVLVEKILPREEGAVYPRCIKGRRACPPEDCGGIWGYADLLEILADPSHPDYEEMQDWVGEDFDPDAFDLVDVNARLDR